MQIPTQPADLLSAAASLFNNLAATLADPQKTARLTASLIAKDRHTGKQYLKIPLENERLVTEALNTLNNLLSGLKK